MPGTSPRGKSAIMEGWMTLRIQKSTNREDVVLILSGHLGAGLLEELQKTIETESGSKPIVLDLREVQLVDRECVRFLARFENEGILLENCPPYIREWIERERPNT
jgi:anti-anti-sigma regulatory factor